MEEDDPELWATVAASLRDQGGLDSGPQSSCSIKRHLSGVDTAIANELREQRAQGRWRSPVTGLTHFGPRNAARTEETSLMLPSFAGHPPRVRSLVLGQITNPSLTAEAEGAGVINAIPLCTHLLVLRTLGDGNCLDHAASMAIWGVHDRDGELRDALRSSMCDLLAGPAIRARFSNHLNKVGIPPAAHAAEWEREVAALEGDDYLSDIHAFVLANVLRRPILVYGDGQAATAGMTGIYLPVLAAAGGEACWREPIAVLFCHSHFSLLVTVEGESPVNPPLLPLASPPGQPLLPRFLSAEEEAASPSPCLAILVRHMACLELAGGGLGVRLNTTPHPNFLMSLLRSSLLAQGVAEAALESGTGAPGTIPSGRGG